ncbi:MAG TPA: hypothetical protein PK566_17990 [Pseudobacteroides sp.]|nr:hypothetical protein [Pseudobacteroides sp.]
MNKTLIETYTYKFDNKTTKIQIYKIDDNKSPPVFYSVADYKRVICEASTIEEAKKKCEEEIDIKVAVASGKIKLIDSKKAEDIAKSTFKQFLSAYIIPAGLEKRIGVSYSQKGKEWVFDIYLYPEIPITSGLEEDLTNPMRETLAVVKVDGETEEAVVIENKEIMFKVFGECK